MHYDALAPEDFAALAERVDAWLVDFAASGDFVLAVDRGGPGECGAGERRWYVRLRGDEKDVTTIWLTLGQRTLRYETYVIPAPPKAALAIYELILRRNTALVACRYAIGGEEAIYLRGETPSVGLADADLDRTIGVLFAEVERTFPALVALAFTR